MFNKNKIKSLLSRPEFSALAIFIFLIIVFTFLNDRFLNSRNFMVILSTYPELALVALGITILMISGEFDLSVGSVFAVSPIITMILIADYEVHYIVSILLGLLAAAFIGFVNAIVTVKFKIPSFIPLRIFFISFLNLVGNLYLVLALGADFFETFSPALSIALTFVDDDFLDTFGFFIALFEFFVGTIMKLQA